MKIYESRIDASSQYEGELCPVLVEYGTDVAELTRRMAAAMAEVAPMPAWKLDQLSVATVSVRESADYTVDYTAYVRPIELVC